MKKTGLYFGIAASFLLLINASVWEGTASVSQALPETGLYVATNSFPVNTVVFITNLETGKSVRLVVSSGLESTGLLALLSRDAADSIGLQEGTMGRIRMGQFTDETANSGYGVDGLSLYNPDAIVDLDEYGLAYGEQGLSQRTDESGLFVDLPNADDILGVPVYTFPDSVLALVPEENLPPKNTELNPDDFITPIIENEPPLVVSQTPENNVPRTSYIDPSLFIEPIRDTPVPSLVGEPAKNEPEPTRTILEPVRSEPAPVEDSTGFTITRLPGSIPSDSVPSGTSNSVVGASFQSVVFSAPLIGSLEKGSYYVQIGAYSRSETVESEIRKIDQQLPVAIMNAGSEEKPVYRVLIGPLNLGESGAILQRYKGIYKDAFVRQGS